MNRIDWSHRRPEIERLASEGKTDQEIADFYGVSRPSVFAARCQLGIVTGKRRQADSSAPIRVYLDKALKHEVKVYRPYVSGIPETPYVPLLEDDDEDHAP